MGEAVQLITSLTLLSCCAWLTIGSGKVSSGCERVPSWRGLQSAVGIRPPQVPELHSAGMREDCDS